ncbi:MAG: hypothetical protein AVDCRST_MAG32-1103, partial [uncultured Nocardioides sp.]
RTPAPYLAARRGRPSAGAGQAASYGLLPGARGPHRGVGGLVGHGHHLGRRGPVCDDAPRDLTRFPVGRQTRRRTGEGRRRRAGRRPGARRPDRRRRPPRRARRGGARRDALLRLHPCRLSRVALVGDDDPRQARQGRHGQRGGPAAGCRRDRGPAVGALQGAHPARRPVARRPAAGRGRGRPPGPDLSRGRRPARARGRRPGAARRGRPRPGTGADAQPRGHRHGRRAVVRRPRRPRVAARQGRPRPVHDVRVPRADERVARGDVRRVRQRQRQRRRPRGLLRPRVRRALRGQAGPAQPAGPGARARPRHPRARGRARAVL